MRGSGWATDWPKAVRGLNELAHATDGPLRKGGGLMFLPVQEKQEIERNALTKCRQNRHGRRGRRGRVVSAASRCAAPLRLATLASVEQRSVKHFQVPVGLREDPRMRECQEIISREQIRVASSELPWVVFRNRSQPCKGCSAAQILGEPRPGRSDAATPTGLTIRRFDHTQGSSCLATLG